MKASFNSRYYAEAGEFVTKEESRYALMSVHVEPHPKHGVILIATDGHTLCVFHDGGGQVEGDGITLRFKKTFASLCGDNLTCQLNEDGSLSLFKGMREVVRFTDMVEGKAFPSWRAVLPKWNPEIERNDYNAHYLERCGKLAETPWFNVAIWSGSDGLQISHGTDRPAVVCAQGREDAFFLVMPMRQTNEMKWPALLDALRPQETEAPTEPERETEITT